MATSTRQLLVQIVGDAKGFLDSAKQSEDGASKLGDTFKKLAVVAAGAFAVKEVVDFGKDSVQAFKNVAGETAKLQRLTGGSAEEMSRLRFAGSQVGITADQLSGAFVKFSKAGLGPAKDELAKMGVSFTDAQGNAKPLTEQLELVADKFKALPEGTQQNALALKLFGKSGTDLIPILNKGKDGIQELMEKSDKFGLTIGQDGVDSLKKYNSANRDLQAAQDGLKVTVGAALMPVMAKFVGFLAENAQPAFQKIREVFQDHIVPAAEKVWSALGPVRDVIGAVAEKVVGFFQNNPKELFAALAVIVGGVLAAAFWSVASAILAAISPIILIGIAIAALVVGVMYAWDHFAWFRDGVTAAWEWIRQAADTVATWFMTNIWPTLSQVATWIANKFGELVQWTKDHWTAIKTAISDTWDVVVSVIKGAWDSIGGIFETAWGLVSGIFQFFDDLFHGRWSQLWDDVKTTFLTVWQGVFDFFTGLPAVLLGLLSKAGEWLISVGGNIVSGLWSGIKSGADWLWVWFKNLPTTIVNTLGDLALTLWNAGASLMGGLWGGIKSVASSALDIAKDIANSILGFVNDKMIGGFNTGLDQVWKWLPFTSGAFPYHIPKIPTFHSGGVFNSGMGEGLALLQDGETIRTRSQEAALGSGIVINITAGVGNPVEIGRELVDVLRQYERVNGAGWRLSA